MKLDCIPSIVKIYVELKLEEYDLKGYQICHGH